MKNLDEMTPEELRAWADAQSEASRRQFAGQPAPRISRAKRDDYPHWHLKTWLSRVAVDVPTQVCRDGGRGAATSATLRGMRMVEDKGPHVLLVDVGRDGLWAVRRTDGRSWVFDIEVDPSTVRIEVTDMPVHAWWVSEGTPPDSDTVLPAPSRTGEWTLSTAGVEGPA